MGNLLNKVQNWWQTADRTQRTVTVFGSAFLVLMLGLTFFYASRPKMEPVFPGMNPEEKDAVYLAIKEMGVPVEYNATRDVMVPANMVNDIRAKLRADNKAPKASGKSLDDILTGSSPFDSPSVAGLKTKAALEGELANSIRQLEGVDSAIVHINQGKDSPFVSDKVEPTAVVNVAERAGTSLTDEQGRAIARIIQEGAGLKPDHVSVVASSGRMIYDGEQMTGDNATMNKKLDAERDESHRRERELQRRLDMAFGPGNTSVTVAVELDMDEVTIVQETTQPTKAPLTSSTVTESLSGDPGTAGGAAGDESNNADALTSQDQSGTGNSYTSEARDEQYGQDKKNQTIRKAPGGVKSMTVSVLVNSQKIEDTKPVEDFVNGLLKTKDKASFSATVTPVAFNQESMAEHNKAQDAANSAARMQQLISLLPIGALVVIGFFLMRALGKSMKPAPVFAAALPDGGAMALPTEPIDRGGPQLRIATPATTTEDGEELEDAPEAVEEIEEEDDTPDLTSALAAMGIGADPEPMSYQEEPMRPVFVGEIREKVDVPLEQIRKLSKEKPETVAMLLKSWLMED